MLKKGIVGLLIALIFAFPDNAGAEERFEGEELSSNLESIVEIGLNIEREPIINFNASDGVDVTLNAPSYSATSDRIKITASSTHLYVRAQTYDVIAEIRFVYGSGPDKTVQSFRVKPGQALNTTVNLPAGTYVLRLSAVGLNPSAGYGYLGI